MPFQSVPATVDLVELEHDILAFWRQSQAFEKLRRCTAASRTGRSSTGPSPRTTPWACITAGAALKDLYSRFWTMRGRELRYQNGFDCQGLWVEVEVEGARL